LRLSVQSFNVQFYAVTMPPGLGLEYYRDIGPAGSLSLPCNMHVALNLFSLGLFPLLRVDRWQVTRNRTYDPRLSLPLLTTPPAGNCTSCRKVEETRNAHPPLQHYSGPLLRV
jgi:hypothetical protein